MKVTVLANPAELAEYASRLVADGLATGERASLGLSGGSTPAATYRQLAAMGMDWSRVDVWLSDERWVPPDHPDSNGGMAGSILTDALIHRPRWADWIQPDESAAHYEATLRELFPTGVPDVIMLGMGDDGHTASLFPATPALDEEHRWYVAQEVAHVGMWRLTATFPLLLGARTAIVLVQGEPKARVLADVLEGPPDTYPVQRLAETAGELHWVIDEAAAARLTTTPVTRHPG